MEEDKNLEQNLDSGNEKLHISGVCNSAYFGQVCKWCKSTKTHYDYVSIEGIEIWQCDDCKQEFYCGY